MENKPLVIALGLFGLGLLATSMVGVVYVAKLDELQRRPVPVGVDWSVLKRFEGQIVTTGGVEFRIHKVYVGEEVNPVVREPIRATCQDAIILRIKARNAMPGPVTITPGIFKLGAAAATDVRQAFQQGFLPPILAPGDERTYQVGFSCLTNVVPCVLEIAGDTLRADPEPGTDVFAGRLDVCPGVF